jgi:AcrR family transcriptional regulator
MHAKRKQSNNPRGRPQSDLLTDSIHTAVFAILQRGSYQSLSIDAIAAQARVSRPSLYRRYGSVGQITLAALEAKGRVILHKPCSADVRKDLCSYFLALVVAVDEGSAVGRALRGTMAAALVDIELRPHFRRFIGARRQPVLNRLSAWNSCYGATELEAIADALFGPLWYRLIIRYVPVSGRDIRRIVEKALSGSMA